MAAVLCADLLGFSRLVAQSEERTLHRLAEQRAAFIDPLLERHHGRVFKAMGDGLLVEFGSVVHATRCALDWQAQSSASQSELNSAERLIWRIAIHLGDVIVDGSDLVGDGVNVAARLQAIAPPGGVLVTRTVRDQLPGGFAIRPAGTPRLKNITRPIEVFEVFGEGSSPIGATGVRAAISARSAVYFLGVTAALIALTGLGALFAGLPTPFSAWWSTGSAPAVVQTSPPLVLVAPIKSESAEERTALLAAGLTDEIISGLSRFSNIQVFGRNTSEALVAGSVGSEELRERYGLRYILHGTMRVLEEEFRLNFELVDTSEELTRWAQRYEEDLSGAFRALDDVVANVVSNAVAKISRSELEGSRIRAPQDLTAYELTLQGRQLWQRANRENIINAQELLKSAIARDPSFPPPYAYLAFTYLTSYNNRWSEFYEDPSALHEMLRLSSRALDLDPGYATAYAAQAIAYTYLGRHNEASDAASRAIAANPNDPDVLGRVAQVLSFSGEQAKAVEILRKAIELDPFGPAQWFNFLARAYFFSGQDEQAVSAARTCLERSQIRPCRETLAAALALSGQMQAAAATWRELAGDNQQVTPEQLVARLRPAFRNQNELDRVVEGLSKAQAYAAAL